jgi:hypothetical protein
MSIAPPRDSIEFGRLLDRLAHDITYAAIFRSLRADLSASFNEYSREFNQSQAFWSLSLQSYIEAAIHRLSRVYVSHSRALSLESWLEAIKNNPQWFASPPDPVRLDQDIGSVGKSDSIVKKLVQLRGSVVAHINLRDIAENLRLGNRFALTFNDVDLLIARAKAILNRYSLLFKRESWSKDIVGHDDFLIILRALRADLERSDTKVAEQIEPATRAAPNTGA